MHRYWSVALSVLLLTAGCRDEQATADDFKEYEGPTLEVTDAQFLFSDSAVVKNKITAKRQLQYASGNLDFPEGIYVETYGEDETVTSTIVADRGSYDQKENEFTAEGNVVVKNLESGETLKTELLHWNRNDKQVRTDRYVEIISREEVIMGEGLTAEEDMSSYRILKPTGSFSVN